MQRETFILVMSLLFSSVFFGLIIPGIVLARKQKDVSILMCSIIVLPSFGFFLFTGCSMAFLEAGGVIPSLQEVKFSMSFLWMPILAGSVITMFIVSRISGKINKIHEWDSSAANLTMPEAYEKILLIPVFHNYVRGSRDYGVHLPLNRGELVKITKALGCRPIAYFSGIKLGDVLKIAVRYPEPYWDEGEEIKKKFNANHPQVQEKTSLSIVPIVQDG